ncbi:MAG: glycosyltransferase family 47 protein [Azoarcus sp.]|nr:glycosyltransferase family 47 protein [Azoarcus sp.]
MNQFIAPFQFLRRFHIAPVLRQDGLVRFDDVLCPSSKRELAAPGLTLDDAAGCRAALRMLLPLCLDTAPILVGTQPDDSKDVNFWQFPAVTEKLARERHAALPPPAWRAAYELPVDTYLGLPWATYIDKLFNPEGGRGAGHIPEKVALVIGTRLRGYRRLAEHWQLQWGEDVRVHTVCQHIYWDRLLPLWSEWGVTDVHLSHCEPGSQAKAQAFGIRVHSWPLEAANVVNPERREGLDAERPWQERRYLASFIGAQMSHYRSDARLSLRREVQRDGGDEVLFELGDDWHFNPVVYGEQVKGEPMSDADKRREQNATLRYNAVLSDSVFAFCPEGAGPNTLRLWEALAAGAIPVVIVEDWLWPEIELDALSWDDAVIRCGRQEVEGLLEHLRRLLANEPGRLAWMQRNCRRLYDYFAGVLCFAVPT